MIILDVFLFSIIHALPNTSLALIPAFLTGIADLFGGAILLIIGVLIIVLVVAAAIVSITGDYCRGSRVVLVRQFLLRRNRISCRRSDKSGRNVRRLDVVIICAIMSHDSPKTLPAI